MARYRFWLFKKDRKGRPIDKAILKIAEEIRGLTVPAFYI
jgi:hypothetical protein